MNKYKIGLTKRGKEVYKGGNIEVMNLALRSLKAEQKRFSILIVLILNSAFGSQENAIVVMVILPADRLRKLKKGIMFAGLVWNRPGRYQIEVI